MTKEQIIKAINEGGQVFWTSNSYPVVKLLNNYYITCVINTHSISLCDSSGELNGSPEDFYLAVKVAQEA